MIFLSLLAIILSWLIIGCMWCKGTMLAHVQFIVHQDPFFAKLAGWSPAWNIAWAYSLPDAKLSIFFRLTHEVLASPFLQHVKICLNSSPSPQRIYQFPQFGTVCELIESALPPVIQIIDVENNIEQYALLQYIHIYCYNIGVYILFNILALLGNQQNEG